METMEIRNCPRCKSKPTFHVSPAGTRRSPRLEYGLLCSNPKCSWSYACTTYRAKEDAVDHWNEKVQAFEMIETESERLIPCSCGGKAKLIFEQWGSTACGWFVRCESCGKLLTAADAKDAIIESWNRMMSSGQTV